MGQILRFTEHISSFNRSRSIPVIFGTGITE